PAIARLIEGGTRLSYGARALTAGGWQAVPDLAFAGGALLGCAAGFMNAPRLKAIHNAILSGIGAADAVGEAIAAGRRHDRLEALAGRVFDTGIERELRGVRNLKPLWARYGTLRGALLGGLDMWSQVLTGWSPFGTQRWRATDAEGLKPLAA